MADVAFDAYTKQHGLSGLSRLQSYDEHWPSYLAAPVSASQGCFARSRALGARYRFHRAGGSVISAAAFKNPSSGNNVSVNSNGCLDSIIYNHVTGPPLAHPPRHHRPPRQAFPKRTEIGYDLEADKRAVKSPIPVSSFVVRRESLIEEPESLRKGGPAISSRMIHFSVPL